MIFGLLYWIFQVEVLEIYNEVFTIWYGEYAVPMEFGYGLIYYGGGDCTIVGKFVASHCESQFLVSFF